jgi:serine phosphatase RsbU (regulator of sigma subunit)
MATEHGLVSRKPYIFLSHAGAETHAAHELADILRRSGLSVWFDKDDLLPGDPWMATLEEAISHASAMIVYIGGLGIQAWLDREVRFGLVRNTHDRDSFRFIPVLGEGAELTKLPPFVQQHQCVDLRDRQGAAEQIRHLVEGLRNSSCSQAVIPAEYWNTHSPFRSLQTFSPEDSWLFFGRDQDTEELLTRLGRAPAMVVVGNSGSGKSSLIQAGLIPALRRGRFRYDGSPVDSWRIAMFRPSTDPFHYLAETLPGQLAPDLSSPERAKFIEYCKDKLPAGGEALRTAIAALVAPTSHSSGGAHVLLVADQFEELFTLVPDKPLRDRYIDALVEAARLDGAVPVHLVLALRADFYKHCLDRPKLGICLNTNAYNVPLMTPSQLREAIENRLALAGACAEVGLIDSLLADVGDEPGNLALLEHALTQLWGKSRGAGHTLANEAYAEIGRLRGSLGKHADEVYSGLSNKSDQNGASDQQLAKQIFLELVQIGEDAQDTRRRIPKDALMHLGSTYQVERVIARLASRRLLTTSSQGSQSPVQNFVEVSHEALIREWPKLRGWLNDNRGDLRFGRTLLQAAQEWNPEKDSSALIRGNRLGLAQEWLVRNPKAPPLVEEFLRASAEEELRLQVAEQQAARFEMELSHAREMQRSLLPPAVPVVKGYELSGLNLPCGTVGGDYYDFIPYADGRIALLVSDASGKGFSAALMMTSLQARVHMLAESMPEPAPAVAALNRTLAARYPQGGFVTLFYAVLDPPTGWLSYANAGHNYPVLVRPKGGVEMLTATGLPLGIVGSSEYETHRVQLEVGDTLCLYSDGVTEVQRRDGEDEFGEGQLVQYLAENQQQPLEEAISQLAQYLRAWSAQPSFCDDFTMVLVRRLGTPEKRPDSATATA